MSGIHSVEYWLVRVLDGIDSFFLNLCLVASIYFHSHYNYNDRVDSFPFPLFPLLRCLLLLPVLFDNPPTRTALLPNQKEKYLSNSGIEISSPAMTS